jgi:uncharacterized protein (DUF1810 family)
VTFDLDRFVTAQAGIYDQAVVEIRRGRKTSHWMWFIFPQISGLGHSPTARHYAIRSLDEAKVYLAHPILGERLRACVAALPDRSNMSARDIFGEIDAMKLRSSLTLFAEASENPAFANALARWFGGYPDPMTIDLLSRIS